MNVLERRKKCESFAKQVSNIGTKDLSNTSFLQRASSLFSRQKLLDDHVEKAKNFSGFMTDIKTKL